MNFPSLSFIGLVLASNLAGAESLKPPIIGEQKDGLTAEAAAKNFSAYEGFQIVQSAAEPDVRQPVAMAIDPRGRVWIAEAYEYPKRAEGDVGKDRILIFEDTDGDGIFDKRKVFYEGLNLVSGLEIGFGGVFVGAAPYLMFIPDANGDDQPDGKPQVLLDGFGWHDTHETLNSFTWGPDGWLYGCHGVFTHSKVGKPGTPDDQRTPLNAGVWRYHPTRKTFEVFAQGTSNPWGVDFNDYGQSFITACVIPHLYHVIQGGRYQRQAGQHFDPYTYDDIKTIADHLHYKGDQWAASRDGTSSDFGGGHAHCGLSIYLGDNFPDAFRGKLLFNNLHGHRMNQDMVEREGSGFVGKHQPDFLFSNDRQHMGVAVKYGPDGGLFLTDWYDSTTCHTVNGELWNRTNGRIYKITYGKSQAKPVDLTRLSDVELAGLQLHKNDWFVRNARKLLQERAAAGTLDAAATRTALQKILTDNADETRRLRALWAMHAAGVDSEELLLKTSADRGEYMRAWSVQLLAEKKEISAAAGKRFEEMSATDSSQVVRLYLGSALQRIPLAQRWGMAAALVAHAEDAGDHNLPLIDWYGVSDLAGIDQARALKLAIDCQIPTVRKFLVRRISSTSEGRERVIEWAGTAEASPVLPDVLAGLSMALTSERNLPQGKSWSAASVVFAALTDADSRKNFQLVATVFGDERMAALFKKSIAELSLPKDERLAAKDNLLRMRSPDAASILMTLADNSADPLRAEWIRSMGQANDEATVGYLIRGFPKFTAAEKEAAIQALVATEKGARQLSLGLADSSIKRTEVSAFAARQMRSYDKPDITGAVEKYWGMISSGPQESKVKEIEQRVNALRPAVLASANLQNGRRIFQGTCFACHTLFGEGNKIGPDLTGSNRGNLKYLLENIVDPSALVGLDYQLHTIEKNDGQMVAGMLREQSPTALTIAMIGGATVNVQKSEIKDHKILTTSMMPEGLLANLTENEARDLIGYLQSQKQVPLPVEGEVMIGDDQLKVAEVNRGIVQAQSMAAFKADSWSEGTQLWWTKGQPTDRLVLQFNSAVAGRFEVFGVFTKAFDYGKFRVKLNGETVVDSIDLYQAKDVTRTGDISFGTRGIKAGLNQLIFEILGANPAAKPEYMLGVDHLRLVPVK